MCRQLLFICVSIVQYPFNLFLNHLLVTSSETAGNCQTIAFTLAKRKLFVYLFFLMLSS